MNQIFGGFRNVGLVSEYLACQFKKVLIMSTWINRGRALTIPQKMNMV